MSEILFMIPLGYFALIATASVVAIFSSRERSDRALRVLKELTRRKPDRPDRNS